MPDSANLYIYARNNPIRYQDPDGHDPEENEFAILREMGLTEYLKRSYKMIWDELSYSNEHFATFGTFDMLTYAFSGLEYGILKANGADINYLEVGAVFKDTSNTAQAVPKAEKAVAESGEEILEQTGKAIESGLNSNLLDELANSGVKYNPEDIVAITKTADGKLVWLENGTDSI